METIATYVPTVGIAAVKISEPADKIYDFFQSLAGNTFLFTGDHGYLEFVPVKETNNPLIRYGRQLILLFKQAIKSPRRPFSKRITLTPYSPTQTTGESNDFFCQSRASKQVLFEGKEIKVLYPDNPITKNHFLFATKKHRDSFKDISKEEFVEVIDLAKQVSHLFRGEKYSLCKTGFDAGQTASHFHFHLIVVEDKVEGIYARFKVMKNIIFNMIPFLHSRLKGEALLKRVSNYRRMLACLNS